MHQYSQGRFTKQAHKGIPEGHFEEEQGLEGFYGPVSHLIRKAPITRWTHIDGPLRPRMYDLVEAPKSSTMQRLLFNNDTTVSWLNIEVSAGPWSSYRNADGDTCYFCHKGQGKVLTEYGALDCRPGTYVVVPKSLGHTFVMAEPGVFLVIENKNSHFREPDRGMVGRHAFYDIAQIGKPDLEAQMNFVKERAIEVKQIVVKRDEQLTRFHYSDDVYDVIGWKGDLFPFSLRMDDMMPLNSHRAHLPPSAHTTFVARNFVICSFLPRPLETDADALKVPFYHQNIDYDEVLFYHDGNFFSRDNLRAGMLSFHPAGFPHGPHPKAFKAVEEKKFADEYAVMLDARFPLQRDPFLDNIELKNYWQSWKT
jgi:homogentisate 1,2-dioxygenase